MFGERGYTCDKAGYMRRRHFQQTIIVALVVLTAVVSVYSLSVTQYPLTFAETMDIISKHFSGAELVTYEDIIKDKIIFEQYIPRISGGLIIGAILGMSGAAMQSVIRNPLADPYTTGISSGASFGVTLFVVFGICVLPVSGSWGLVINAFVFSLIPAAAIILFSLFGRSSSTMMILVGIGVMMVFGAATQLMMYAADEFSTEEIYEWNVGSLGLLQMDNMPFLLAGILVLTVAMALLSDRINLMNTGDRMASTMGINPARTRIVAFVVISLCTAVAVCFSGSIGFVGLVVPHVCRLLIGPSKFVLPMSAVLGGFLLVSADAVARIIILGGLPVGVITSAIGGPVLLYFLVRSKKGGFYSN